MGFLKIVFVLVVLTLVRWLLSSLSAKPSAGARKQKVPHPSTGKMIRDPHCGTHVAQELAIQAETHGDTLMFCSERCRDEYLLQHQPSEQSG